MFSMSTLKHTEANKPVMISRGSLKDIWLKLDPYPPGMIKFL